MLKGSEIRRAVRDEMKDSIESLRRAYSSITVGQAKLNMLDNVKVPYYGAQVGLDEVASLSVKGPYLIVVKPWEKSMIPVIEDAIKGPGGGTDYISLHMNPVKHGEEVHVNVPPITEEKRGKMIKLASERREKARVSIRLSRQVAIDQLRHLPTSNDEFRQQKEKVEKLTSKFLGKVRAIYNLKVLEISHVK